MSNGKIAEQQNRILDVSLDTLRGQRAALRGKGLWPASHSDRINGEILSFPPDLLENRNPTTENCGWNKRGRETRPGGKARQRHWLVGARLHTEDGTKIMNRMRLRGHARFLLGSASGVALLLGGGMLYWPTPTAAQEFLGAGGAGGSVTGQGVYQAGGLGGAASTTGTGGSGGAGTGNNPNGGSGVEAASGGGGGGAGIIGGSGGWAAIPPLTASTKRMAATAAAAAASEPRSRRQGAMCCQLRAARAVRAGPPGTQIFSHRYRRWRRRPGRLWRNR